jgi:hypothetical protein
MNQRLEKSEHNEYKIYNDLSDEDRPWDDVDILKKYLETDDEE